MSENKKQWRKSVPKALMQSATNEKQLDSVIEYCEQAIETNQFSVVPLSELKIPEHYCRIEREAAEGLLAKSIMERGQIVPLIANNNPECENELVDGVGRLQIMQVIGSTTAKVIYIDVAKADVKRVTEELNLRCRLTQKMFLEENGLEDFVVGAIDALEQKENTRVKVLSDKLLNNKAIKDDVEPLHYSTSTAKKMYLRELKKKWRKANLSQVIDLIIEKFQEYENTEI